MVYRKLYIKINRFFYSIRRFLNGITVTAMLLTLLYLFVNAFIFERLVMVIAHNDEAKSKYENAISLYGFAYIYYGINHISEGNKKIYFEIPYRTAICYLDEGNKEKSIETVLYAITTIQKQYGVLSKENAYFIRKYLIAYYLDNNKNYLARQEFGNLVTIYKKIGYNDNEMSDIIRLSGDLYYQQGQYDTAMSFYDKAYKEISTQSQIDYDVFSKIVNRICEYETANGRTDTAVGIYRNSINILKSSGRKQNELAAIMLLKLADLYSHSEDDLVSKNAIPYYEEAIVLIKKLPRTSLLRGNLRAYLLTLKDLDTKNSQYHDVQLIDAELTKMERFSFLY